MTYREILIEFDKRRLNPTMFLNPKTNEAVPSFDGQINDLQWAIASILEKLAEKEES